MCCRHSHSHEESILMRLFLPSSAKPCCQKRATGSRHAEDWIILHLNSPWQICHLIPHHRCSPIFKTSNNPTRKVGRQNRPHTACSSFIIHLRPGRSSVTDEDVNRISSLPRILRQSWSSLVKEWQHVTTSELFLACLCSYASSASILILCKIATSLRGKSPAKSMLLLFIEDHSLVDS